MCIGVKVSEVSDPQKLELQTVLAVMWVLGIEPGPLEEQPVLLAPEPSLQTHF